MGIEARVSAVAAFGVQGLIGSFGGDPERIFGAARLPVHDAGNPTARFDLRRYCDLFEQAARQTGVDSFGLHFGRSYRVEDMGSLGRLALNMPSLGGALQTLCRYFPAMQEHSSLSLRAEGGMLRLEYQIRDGRIAARRQDAELSIGIFNNFFIRCFGQSWSPEEVHFEHLRAADATDYRRLLNAPVYFAQPTNAILFRRTALEAPMPGADFTQLTALRAQVVPSAAQARQDDFTGQVVQHIRTGLLAGDASIETVAAQLGMSRAKLYRRLAELGQDFAALTQNIRQELALIYVAQPQIPFTDIAALLGYSELSAFSRAFRRWTAMSPAACRLSVAPAGGINARWNGLAPAAPPQAQ